MSHYNIIHKTDPEVIQEENHRKVAREMHALFNRTKYEFSSADYYREVDLKKKEEAELAKLAEQLLSTPAVVKKVPLLQTRKVLISDLTLSYNN